MKKRLTHTISLKLFEDEGGMFGLTHKETYDHNDRNFDAFWDGRLIFHDVFEHWFEHEHKYFMGQNAMNICGEMVAMGAMWYYVDDLNLWDKRLTGGYQSHSDSMRTTTEDMVKEAIEDGNIAYGSTLETGMPKQSPTDNEELEWQINEFWKNVQNLPYCEDEYSKDYAKEFKQSVTFRKIADSHRYGYRMAEKMVPDTRQNMLTIYDFIDYWDKFCEKVSAEELMNAGCRGIDFKIYKDSEGNISWKAEFDNMYPLEDFAINQDQNWIPDVYDICREEFEEEEY